jgi:hypothetical protein
VRLRLAGLACARGCRRKPTSLRARIASASWRACARSSIVSSPGPPMCCVQLHRFRHALPYASLRRRETAGAAARAAVVRAGMGTGSAWDRMQAARDRHRKAPGQHAGTPCARRALSRPYPMRASKSCISWMASSASTRASSCRASTITGRLGRTTSASGARRAAPAFSSPAPKIPFAEALRTRAAPIERSLVRAGRPHVGPKRRNDRRNRERRRPAEGVLSPRDHLGPIQKPTVVVLRV